LELDDFDIVHKNASNIVAINQAEIVGNYFAVQFVDGHDGAEAVVTPQILPYRACKITKICGHRSNAASVASSYFCYHLALTFRNSLRVVRYDNGSFLHSFRNP
jgi:hypothetical protein